MMSLENTIGHTFWDCLIGIYTSLSVWRSIRRCSMRRDTSSTFSLIRAVTMIGNYGVSGIDDVCDRKEWTKRGD